MNFDFSDDQKMLQQAARDFLDEASPLSVCRSVLESQQLYSKDLWTGAARLGWLGTAIPEDFGGAGFGYLELAVIAEEVGRALAPIPFASTAYLATEAIVMAGSDAQKADLLPQLATGERVATFAVAEKAGQNGLAGIEATFDGSTVSGTKVPVLDGEAADVAVVVAREGSGYSWLLVDLNGDGVARSGVESFDPSRPLSRLVLDRASAQRLGAAGEGASLTERLFDRAAVLLAFEQLGSASRAFEITKEYTLQRYAFGRPIASFQALKHRLADHWCAIELARSNCYYGAWALSNDDPELSVAACLARISASEAFDAVARDMIQMHGGVGYTWEFDCHLFYRRSKLLSSVLGTTSSWKDRLMARIEKKETAAA